MEITTERITFPNPRGQKLVGRLDRPAEGPPLAVGLMAHCFTCSKDIKSINRIGKALAERGLAMLRFDFTGLGESEGSFAETSFSTNLEDITAAAAFLRGRPEGGPVLLVGHSLGGSAMIAAAQRIPESTLVATIASPADTRHIRGLLLGQYPELMSRGEASISFGGRKVRIRKALLDDLETHDIEREAAVLGRGLLVFHSPADQTLNFDHGLRLFNAAQAPRSFITLPDSDHLLLDQEEDARFVADIIAAYVRRGTANG